MPEYKIISTELLHLLTSATNRKEYLDKVVGLIAESIGCSMVGIRILENDQVAYEAYSGFSSEFWEEENQLSLFDDHCFCTRVIRGDLANCDSQFATEYNSVYCNRLQELKSFFLSAEQAGSYRGTCVSHGFNSLAVIPIRRLDAILGAIHLADFEEDKLPLAKIHILEELSPVFAEAVYRYSLEDSLRDSEASLAKAQRVANLGHWDWNLKNDCVTWSDQVYRIFGMGERSDQITFEDYLNSIHPEEREEVRSAIVAAIKENRPYNLGHRVVWPDQTVREVWAQGEVLYDEQNVAERMIGIVQDITERRQAEEQIRFQASLLNQVHNGVFAVDLKGRVIYWNKHAEKLVQYSKEEAEGQSALKLLVAGDNRDWVEEIKQNLAKTGYWAGEIEVLRKNGDIFPAEVTLTILRGERMTSVGYVGVFSDITARKRMETQLSHLTTHDSLTNLYNRHALEDNLLRAVALARRGESSVLLLVGIDNFHLVNEEQGYAAGDEYLLQFASFLKKNMRDADMIARLGGDEFAILLEGNYNADIFKLADRLRYRLDEEAFHYNLSITVGIMVVDGNLDADQIITVAGIRLDEAKALGKNRVVILEKDLPDDETKTESSKMLGLIKNALKNDYFQLHYQPVVDLQNRSIAHFECLVRLIDPNSGELVTPARFIPLAEKFGIMSQIDSWVFNKAVAVLQEHERIKLYINLSGASLGDEQLLEMIKRKMLVVKFDPDRLGFEITETSAVRDLLVAERWIKQLKDLCCSFALDDFGIGFSSFSYLKLLSVDAIKIDGMFIKNLEHDENQQVIVRAIKNVANSMGKKTIAEFVENETALKILREIGIDYGQGYYLGKPAPVPGMIIK